MIRMRRGTWDGAGRRARRLATVAAVMALAAGCGGPEVRLEIPGTVGGFTLDQETAQSTKRDQKALSARAGKAEPVSGLYLNPHVAVMGVLVVAYKAEVDEPAAEVDKVLNGLPGVTLQQAVDAGPMGGTAKCASTELSAGEVTCVWVDEGSVGSVVFYGVLMDQFISGKFEGVGPGLFTTFRGAVEHRS